MAGKDLIFRLIKKMKDHKAITILIAIVLSIIIIISVANYTANVIELNKQKEVKNEVVDHVKSLGYECCIEYDTIYFKDSNGSRFECWVTDYNPYSSNDGTYLENMTINGINVVKATYYTSQPRYYIHTSNGIWISFEMEGGDIYTDADFEKLVINY